MLRCGLLAACIAVAAYLGARAGHRLRAGPVPDRKPRLTVIFSGEDLGRIEPCGCTPAMLGGLARRPARIRASAEPGVPSAVVSGGMAVAGSDDYDRLRLGVILRALGRMECAAFAPSPWPLRKNSLYSTTSSQPPWPPRMPFSLSWK